MKSGFLVTRIIHCSEPLQKYQEKSRQTSDIMSYPSLQPAFILH